ETPGPSEALVSEETRRRIWAAFRELPRRQQEVFVLRYIDDQSTPDVAQTLGLSAGSVKRHLFRAVRHMRRTLGDHPCLAASPPRRSSGSKPSSARWPSAPTSPR